MRRRGGELSFEWDMGDIELDSEGKAITNKPLVGSSVE